MTSSHYTKTNFPVPSYGLGHTDLMVSIRRSLHVLMVGCKSLDFLEKEFAILFFYFRFDMRLSNIISETDIMCVKDIH